jgi:hypothetical protein
MDLINGSKKKGNMENERYQRRHGWIVRKKIYISRN